MDSQLEAGVPVQPSPVLMEAVQKVTPPLLDVNTDETLNRILPRGLFYLRSCEVNLFIRSEHEVTSHRILFPITSTGHEVLVQFKRKGLAFILCDIKNFTSEIPGKQLGY